MGKMFRMVAACVAALAGTTSAQTQPGSLAGTVLVGNGVAVAEAPIQVKNKLTGAVARTASDSGGRYRIAGLPAGAYELSIVMPCCAYGRFTRDVTLEPAQNLQFDIRLTETLNGATLGDDPGRTVALMRKRAKVPSGPAPRAPGGKPDLSGVWLSMGDPYPEEPELLPWAAAVRKERAENFAKDSPHNRCLPGPPPLPGASTPFIAKLVQTRSLVVMLFEDVPGFRQIFLDGRSHPSELEPSWMGHSVGRWERDTLVVDTVGFNDRSWIGLNGTSGGLPHTEMLRMTERYGRPDFGHLEIQVTFEDSGTFAKPYRGTLRLALAPQEELLEFVCENNKPEHLVGK
jgi:hypothetical protein